MIGDGLGRLLTLVGVAPRFSRELLVRSAERWKTGNVEKQAASNALRSGGIEMASNRLFSLRTPRTTPNTGVCQKT